MTPIIKIDYKNYVFKAPNIKRIQMENFGFAKKKEVTTAILLSDTP